MGSAQPDETGEGSYDLFDRWLAHRETGVDPGAGAEPEPVGPEADPLFDEAFVASHDEELALEPDNPPELLSPTPESPASPPVAESRPTDHDAARAVLAAFAAQAEPEQAAPPAAMREPAVLRDAEAVTRPVEPRAEVTAEPLPATTAAPAPGPVTTPATDPQHDARHDAQHEPDHDVLPPVVEFAPRTGTRRLVGLVLLLCLAATAVAAYSAYLAPTTAAIGIAATLGVLTLVVWAVRASTAPAQVTVRGGQVEVVRAGSRHRFDLASHYTPVDVIGEPGDRSWKVLFHRRSMTPFVVDASMVDPVEFTRVLRRYRPERD